MRAQWLAPLVLVCGMLAGSSSACWSASYDELNAGITARNRNEWDSSIRHFDAALTAGDLKPDQQFIAHFDRAEAHIQQKAFDAGLADLAACLDIRPRDLAVLDFRAQFYANIGKPELALPDLDTMIASNSGDTTPYYRRGQLYQWIGNNQKALEDFEIFQAREPTSKGIFYSIGLAHMALGQLDKATESFSRAVEGWPGYAWLWLAIANLQQGKSVPSEAPTGLKGQDWPAPLVDYFNGRGTEPAIRDTMANGQSESVKIARICQADFYLGEWRLLHNDVDGGKSLLQKTLRECPRNSVEASFAKLEIKDAH